jgi:predicted PurR-regulated permease PerM
MNTELEPHENGQWSRERVLALVLLVATALALFVCYLLARPFLPALTWALALAVVAHPLHDWIARHLRHPNIAAALAVLAVAIIVVAPTLLIVQKASREIATAVERIKNSDTASDWRKNLKRLPKLERLVERLESRFNFEAAADSAVGELAAGASSVVKGSVQFAVQLLITFFILFYFFATAGPRWQRCGNFFHYPRLKLRGCSRMWTTQSLPRFTERSWSR